jgi:hypothetical protein
MPDSHTYEGSCHCGAVRFKVTTDLARVISCNCSLCSRAGYLLTFVPIAQFELLSGTGAVTDYLFNKHHIHHEFCATCGVRSYARATAADGQEMRAINVRCLEGVDVDALTLTKVDGKSR